MTKPLFTFAIGLTLLGCSPELSSNNTPPVAVEEASVQPQEVKMKAPKQEKSDKGIMQSMTGTVVYKNLEGGFYGFINENNEKFTFQKLPQEFNKHGLKIKVWGKPRKDVMTFTQYGTVFEVEKAEIIDDSQVKPINDRH
ncbi:hypothetical protein OPS25_10030 [Alteromonas ponticola]|uniref:CSD domain-containing protein n=1 Tax=Alteromonas aquimaris TaxID=2998417 RepID=A0ABT3P7X0_9ALTE|nr:hypothetical protein [Alteromonas aquimaris]MCW8108830.1 hypothetical protein [Alteromonas aquimaris]